MAKSHLKTKLQIRTLQHLAWRLNTPLKDLVRIADSIDGQYRVWEEPKKNGGFRTISAPKPRLRKVQESIKNLLREIKINNIAHCGIRGRSNLTNAKIHTGQKWVFCQDFSKFFPNISHYKVYHLFMHELECSPEVASLLTRLCTLNGGVPQGSPMSMDIANLVCYKIDKRIGALANNFQINYTRYCDDLSFSGSSIPKSFKEIAKEILIDSKFKLNNDKETFKGCHESQIVTGLCVNSKQPKVPRKIRRELRAEKYIFQKYEQNNLPEDLLSKKRNKLQGRITYENYINKGSCTT